MLQINEAWQSESEKSITRYMQTTLLDTDYKIEHHWKMCFSHPHRYAEHPAYQDKRAELLKKVRYVF